MTKYILKRRKARINYRIFTHGRGGLRDEPSLELIDEGSGERREVFEQVG